MNLLPICDPAQFLNEGAIIDLRYWRGSPRNYHVDLRAGSGCLKLDGRKQVTEPGKSFKFIPLAVRMFSAALFGTPEKTWGEFFFLNQGGHLSVFMVHGFSIDNFRNAFRELYYSGANPCQVVWEMSFEERRNVEAKSTYYVANFTFEELPSDSVEIVDSVAAELVNQYHHIYRSDTAHGETLYFVNYSDGSTPTAAEIQADQKRAEALQAALDPPAKRPAASGKKPRTRKKPAAKAAA